MLKRLYPEWTEIEDLEGALQDGLDGDALWRAVGAGDYEDVARILDGAGYELDLQIVDAVLISIPDDILGERWELVVKGR